MNSRKLVLDTLEMNNHGCPPRPVDASLGVQPLSE